MARWVCSSVSLSRFLPRSSLTAEGTLYGPPGGCKTIQLQRQWRIVNTKKTTSSRQKKVPPFVPPEFQSATPPAVPPAFPFLHLRALLQPPSHLSYRRLYRIPASPEQPVTNIQPSGLPFAHLSLIEYCFVVFFSPPVLLPYRGFD